MSKETTINSAAYCESLKKQKKAIKDRQPRKMSKLIVLLHDNVSPHPTNVTIRKLKWEVWEYLFYSPYFKGFKFKTT